MSIVTYFFLFSHDMCLTYRYTSAWGLFQMQIITNHSSWCSILFDRNDHRILSFDSLMLQYSTLSICNVVSHFVSIQSFILVLSTHSCIDFGGTKWITTNYYPPIIIIGSTHLVFLDVKLDLGMSMSLEHFLTKIIERKKILSLILKRQIKLIIL